MLMASVRLNIPTIFVSGGPMEAGVYKDKKYDLIDVMKFGGDFNFSEEELLEIEKVACPTCGSCSGMFTANSMNCLTEAIGMGLPGNGTLLATHILRRKLFENAGRRIVEMAKEYYEKNNKSVLPKSIITKASLLNAMALDIAMGGSTNTVLHLLAIAKEAGVDFTMKEIDMLSRKVPNICKVAPSSHYHIEDVSRAGGIMTIMGELLRNNLIDNSAITVEGKSIEKVIKENDIIGNYPELTEEAIERAYAAPGGYRNLVGFSQNNRYKEIDKDKVNGCIRDFAHCYNKDGGLAVLYGNIAKDGCIVKTAGVDPSIFKFSGRAKVFDSQEQASEAILSDKIKPGDIVIIRYEGPKGGPGMQEMLYPTTYLKSKNLDKVCALLTDGRFSGGTAGLSIGHVSPEAASGGVIALVEDGDIIEIDINNRSIELKVSEQELNKRRERLLNTTGFKPKRERVISNSLKLYSLLVSSADKGATRDYSKLDKLLEEK